MTQLVLSNTTINATADTYTNFWEVPVNLNSLLVVADVGTSTTESFAFTLQQNIDNSTSDTIIGVFDQIDPVTADYTKYRFKKQADGVLLAQTDGNFTVTTSGIVTTTTGIDQYIMQILNPPPGFMRLRINGQSGSTSFVIDSIVVSP